MIKAELHMMQETHVGIVKVMFIYFLDKVNNN